MATGGPGGGGAARRRQRGSVRPAVSAGRPPEVAGGGIAASDPMSPLEGWAFATMLCSVSQKLAQACRAGSGSSVPRVCAAA